MSLKVNWNQPSTQRGLAMALAGALQIVAGQEISVDLLQVVINGVIGTLMLTSGLIGIFRSDPPAPSPDRPTVEPEPEFKPDPDVERLRHVPLSPEPDPFSLEQLRLPPGGWPPKPRPKPRPSDSGFGDR